VRLGLQGSAVAVLPIEVLSGSLPSAPGGPARGQKRRADADDEESSDGEHTPSSFSIKAGLISVQASQMHHDMSCLLQPVHCASELHGAEWTAAGDAVI